MGQAAIRLLNSQKHPWTADWASSYSWHRYRGEGVEGGHGTDNTGGILTYLPGMQGRIWESQTSSGVESGEEGDREGDGQEKWSCTCSAWRWWGWCPHVDVHAWLRVTSCKRITTRNKEKEVTMEGNISWNWLPRGSESLPLMAFKAQLHKAVFCSTWLWNNFSDGNQQDHLQRSIPTYITLDSSLLIPKANPNPKAGQPRDNSNIQGYIRTFPLPKIESVSKSNNELNLLQVSIFKPDYSS